MNLKSILKAIKLNESTISMVLGAIVIIVVGILVVNFFGSNKTGEIIPPVGTEKNQQITLPTTHAVQEGEDLWSISETYYGSGYNWTDIANANELTEPNQISAGQELTIPAVTPKLAIANATPTVVAENTQVQLEEPTATPEPTIAVITDDLNGDGQSTTNTQMQGMEPITGSSYTVVHGDNLWDIAVRAYGDGYKWVEIANANDLANPNLIHTGNLFVIPR